MRVRVDSMKRRATSLHRTPGRLISVRHKRLLGLNTGRQQQAEVTPAVIKCHRRGGCGTETEIAEVTVGDKTVT